RVSQDVVPGSYWAYGALRSFQLALDAKSRYPVIGGHQWRVRFGIARYIKIINVISHLMVAISELLEREECEDIFWNGPYLQQIQTPSNAHLTFDRIHQNYSSEKALANKNQDCRNLGCGALEEFLHCGSPCPPTCDTLREQVCCEVACVAGCYCANGFILETRHLPRKCVPLAACRESICFYTISIEYVSEIPHFPWRSILL
ncbi:g-protein coupled receptor 98, partial [Caerostris extrusa]